MGMTMTQKILAAAAGLDKVEAGQLIDIFTCGYALIKRCRCGSKMYLQSVVLTPIRS